MLQLADQTATASASRSGGTTEYEVNYQGRTYTRITFGGYLWATIVERGNNRWAEWSDTSHEALHPIDIPADAHVVAVVLLAQPA